MKYAKIVNNKVIQIQPYFEEGFVKVPDFVVAGMVIDENGNFINPSDTFERKKKFLFEQLRNLFVSLISQTDYIYLKAQDLGVNVSALYPNKLQWRKNLRSWYEIKKKQISQATTKKELQAIRIDDYPPMPEEN